MIALNLNCLIDHLLISTVLVGMIFIYIDYSPSAG